MEYYRPDERLVYMQDYNRAIIVPILHRNTINFYGIKEKDEYVVFNNKGDMLIALDYNNILTTYSITTGKVLNQIILRPPVINENQRIWTCDGG